MQISSSVKIWHIYREIFDVHQYALPLSNYVISYYTVIVHNLIVDEINEFRNTLAGSN